MNSLITASVIILCVTTALIVRAGRENHDSAATPAPVSADIPLWLEEQIPYDIRVSAMPAERCDPINLTVAITRGPGAASATRWLVMDEDTIQMEFSSFDDLYYRCDGPGCFNIHTIETDIATGKTMHTTRWHVCLK